MASEARSPELDGCHRRSTSGWPQNDLAWFRGAAEELVIIVDRYGTPASRTAAAAARGSLAFAVRDAASAIREFGEAAEVYRQAEMPYHAACIRRALGEALIVAQDRVGAVLELRMAGRLFEALGAAPGARDTQRRLAQLEA